MQSKIPSGCGVVAASPGDWEISDWDELILLLFLEALLDFPVFLFLTSPFEAGEGFFGRFLGVFFTPLGSRGEPELLPGLARLISNTKESS